MADNATLGTTYQTFQGLGLREDLENLIYDISPTDTPFISMAGRTPVSQTLHEWQTESLATASTANAQIQGVNYTEFAAAVPTVRVGNYTQIFTKLVLVSATMEAVSKAGRATEMAFTNDLIDAQTALGYGLVNRVFKADELLPQTREIARRLAQMPTKSIGLTKRAFNRAFTSDIDESLENEAFMQEIAGHTADHREGVSAFMEKRHPVFKGK